VLRALGLTCERPHIRCKGTACRAPTRVVSDHNISRDSDDGCPILLSAGTNVIAATQIA
jgi:hypothetical protein